MSAFEAAFKRAAGGLDWSYPCLIWVADYVRAETGRDPADEWRAVRWNEADAKRLLALIAMHGQGATRVERALDAIAKREGWQPCDGARQGACMIGVFTAPDDPAIGIPAIFDGWKGWLVCYFGVATILRGEPIRIWEIAR